MAKQNFLAGGYYGKLGQTVGQRWKNIRTIRSYVIPSNPRTEIQQKNRGRFGDCVFYAQLANQLNYKAPCFKSNSMTDWNYRMKTARELQDLGLEELERIPLYPTSLSVPYTISEATITEQITSTRVKIAVSGNLPEKERVLTLVLLSPGTEDFKNRLAVCVGSNTESDPNTFIFQLPDTLQLVDGMKGRFISCDDDDSSADLIASSQIDIAVQTKDIHAFDTTITAAERSGNNFTFTFAEPYNNGTNAVEVASLHCVVNGAWQDVTGLSGELINRDEQFALVLSCSASDNQDLWALPVGSKLNLTSISTNSATVEATAENTESATSNSDLSRTYKNTISSISRNNQAFTVAFSRALPENATANGNLVVHAVKNGAFADSTISAYALATSSLSFNTAETYGEDILAFPAGATITANLSLSCLGVTYTAETATAQSATNTSDLARNVTRSPAINAQALAFYLEWEFGDEITIGSSSVNVELKYNPYFMTSYDTVSLSVEKASSKKLGINLRHPTQGLDLAFVGSYAKTLGAVSCSANGVTYRVAPQTFNYDTSSATANLNCNGEFFFSYEGGIQCLFSGEDKIENPPTAASCQTSGLIGFVTSSGQWCYNAQASGTVQLLEDSTDNYFIINTAEPSVGAGNDPANIYPSPINLRFTQGGKNFNVSLYNGGASFDTDIGD